MFCKAKMKRVVKIATLLLRPKKFLALHPINVKLF